MYLIRNRTFTKSNIDNNFQFISDSADFKFKGHDINRIRKKLNELDETMSILYNQYKEMLQFDSIEVVNIDEVNKTMVENEVMIGTEEVISIEPKEEIEIRTNIEEVGNLNIKLRAVIIIDKEDTSDVAEFEKSSKIPVKEKIRSAKNQNSDKISCLLDSIIITLLQDITVNTNKSDENLNDEIKDIDTTKIISKVVATASKEYDNSNANYITACETNKTNHDRDYGQIKD